MSDESDSPSKNDASEEEEDDESDESEESEEESGEESSEESAETASGTPDYEEPQGLGYDKDEQSDVSYDETKLDFGLRRQLNRMVFRPGLEKLAAYIDMVPGAREYSVPEPVLEIPRKTLDQANSIARKAMAVNLEHAAALQKQTLLREKRELIRWHLNSNSKVLSVKESWVLRVSLGTPADAETTRTSNHHA